MTFFPPVERWILPEMAFRLAMDEMALDGAVGNEGIAMWLGTRGSGVAEITHVAFLRGPSVQKHPALINLLPPIMNALTIAAAERELAVVAQIHSHGPWHGVSLSPTDMTMGICVPGFLSIVAPDYALRRDLTVMECGVHVFEQALGFRRMTAGDVRAHVVGSSAHVETIVVSEDQ